MGRPAFRFVTTTDPVQADDQFWRDIDSSERVASAQEADHFIRSLCHARAMDDAYNDGEETSASAVAHRESALIRQAQERGYRVISMPRAMRPVV